MYDDHPLVAENPAVNPEAAVHQPVSWCRLWLEPYWPKSLSSDTLYRPLTVFSLRVNALAAGDPIRPEPLRAVNIGLHVLAAIGVVVLAQRLTGSVAAGGLAGVLFATHPVHTEAVVPIYGRSELLVGCLGAWLLARHIRRRKDDPRRSARYSVFSGLLFLAALMSKENAIFLWPVLMAIDLWHRRDPNLPSSRLPRREWFNRVFAPPHISFALAAATFLVFRCMVFGWRTHLEAERTRIYEVPMAHVGWIEHLLTPFRLLWLVIRNLVLPDSLCPIWSYPALAPADRLYGDVLAGIAVAAIVLAMIAVLWRRRDLAGALLAGTIVTLAIPIQAVPGVSWFYAERWLYLPTVLIAVLIGAALRKWGRAAAVGGVAAAFLLLPQSWQYSAKFADDLTMQREVILRQPGSFQGRRIYAAVLYHQGRYSEAIQAANQLIERFGEVSDAYKILLLSHLELGDGRGALDAIDKYEDLRRHFPEPALVAERHRALRLIAGQRIGALASRPAASKPQ